MGSKVIWHLRQQARPRATLSIELAAMQDLGSELFNFDTFFASNDDEGVDGLWALSATLGDDDLLDVADLEPLSSMKEESHQKQEQVQVKQEPANKFGLKIDTKLNTSSKKGWLAQRDNDKANGTPTSTLPARFALLSTTCVYEPGFTTSPRGKRRISQTHVAQTVDPQNEGEDEDDDGDGDDDRDDGGEDGEDGVADGGDDEPFMLSGAEDYGLPVFTDAELSTMVELPLNMSSTATSSAAPYSPRGPAHGETSFGNPIILNATNTMPIGAEAGGAEHGIPDAVNMSNTMYDSSQNFSEAQQQTFDLLGAANSSIAVSPHISDAASQAVFAAEPVRSFNSTPVVPVSTAPNDGAGVGAMPFDYFTPSSYASAANQFLDSYGQQVQPFFLNPDATPFQCHQAQENAANVQLAAAMAIANSVVMNTLKMNANYGVPVQRRAGSMHATTQVKVAVPLKLRLPAQRAVSATSAPASARAKGSRVAITPDIADFKLVQIFHQFCDPITKVLTLPRFQQLILHHQIKEDSASKPDSATDGTADAQTLFSALDTKGVGLLDLECFMHSFQICNRCTEVKRRAYKALCASQGQTFMPTALERQLMEDVAPVVVRVVPTRYEGHKVKSCEHYQWTWCEGFDKTGNEKCRGTNRHDKCPKYLANCTLWKHKLPPKSRKPKLQLENVDSPTKKLKHFS